MKNYFYRIWVVAEFEWRKLRHDPTELFTRAIQPMLWLLIFGEVFAHAKGIPTGPFGYLDFMTPGVLAQSVLFVAIFYGIQVIWEKDLGIVQKLLVTPVPYTALVFGKALAAGIRGLSQAIIVFIVAALIGININWHPLSLAAVLIFVMIGSGLFSTLSLIIACIVKTRERFMGVGQVMTMPIFFASNAIYPIAIMPQWLKVAAYANPLTYQVDALRALMIRGGSSLFGLGLDATVLVAGAWVLVMIAAWLYPSIAV